MEEKTVSEMFIIFNSLDILSLYLKLDNPNSWELLRLIDRLKVIAG